LYGIKHAICKKVQTDIALHCETNPIKFWNFVSSKFKDKHKIGNFLETSSVVTQVKDEKLGGVKGGGK